MAGCKSCQRGGNNADPMAPPTDMDMGSAPGAPAGPEGMGSPVGPELEGSPVGSPAMAGGKKHRKRGGNLTTHAVPVLLTLAATRKGKSLKNRLTLGMLKGGKKSRKSKGKGKKTKARKVKKGKKSRKYRR